MIIRTILDTDLYKFTTSYAYIKLFPYAIGTFSFKDRDGTEYSDEFVERLRTEISQLSHVALTEKELEYKELPLPARGLLGVALFFPFPTRENRNPSGRESAASHRSERLSLQSNAL